MEARGGDRLFSVDGKSMVVTGSCGLIGRGIVRALHERGAKLVLAGLPAAGAGELAARTGDAIGVPCEVSEAPIVGELVRRTLEAFGGNERVSPSLLARALAPSEVRHAARRRDAPRAWIRRAITEAVADAADDDGGRVGAAIFVASDASSHRKERPSRRRGRLDRLVGPLPAMLDSRTGVRHPFSHPRRGVAGRAAAVRGVWAAFARREPQGRSCRDRRAGARR